MQDKAYKTELNKLHRYERYQDEVAKNLKLWYFGDESELYSYFSDAPYLNPFEDSDLQLTAVKLALEDYQSQNPKGYAWIAEFYLGDTISEKELGRKHGISQQAVSQRLKCYTRQLRKIALMYLHRLIYTKSILKIKYIGT